MLIGIDANEANITRRVGINMYAYNLLHALKNLKTPHRFTIYLKSPPLADLPVESDHWQYHIIPFPRLWTQTRLPFDLFTHRPRPDIFLSLSHYGPRYCPVPNVVAIMDLGFLLFPDQFTSKDLHQLTKWTSYSVNRATALIAISEYTKKDIIRFYHRRPEDIYLTYLGYNNRLFYPQKDQSVLDRYRIKTPYIVFVSSLKPSKNVEGLIKAYRALIEGNSKYRHLQLVIVGKKAWMYEQIFQLINQMHIQDKVIFTDYVPDKEIPVLMSMSDCFVLPSFYEGFALPAIEAMACKTPVVVSKVANLPEVAGDAVVYVDPNDPDSISRGIAQAIGPNRKHYIHEGSERVKLFSWEKTALQTLICLQTVMEKNSPAAR